MPPTLYSMISAFFITNALIFLSAFVFVWLPSDTITIAQPNATRSLNQTFYTLFKNITVYTSQMNTTVRQSPASFGLLQMAGSLAFVPTNLPDIITLILKLPQFNYLLIQALIGASGIEQVIPGITYLFGLLYSFMWLSMFMVALSIITKYNWAM